jgi:hypothetical protein
LNDPLQPAVTRKPPHPPVGLTRHPAIFLPEEFVADEEEQPVPSTARALRARAGTRRTGLYAASALGTLVVAAAVYVLLGLAPSGTASAAGESDRRGMDAEHAVVLRGDSLAMAIEAFDLRLSMMERRQMGCPELARGLIQVEGLWISYSLARRALQNPLDNDRSGRDSTLFAAVTAVERRFERAGCARP